MLYLHKTAYTGGAGFDESLIVEITLAVPSVIRVGCTQDVTIEVYQGAALVASKAITASSTPYRFVAALEAGTYEVHVVGATGGFLGAVYYYDGIELKHVNAGAYDPKMIQKTVEHQLADGGTFVVDFATEAKYENTLKVEFCDDDSLTFLQALFDARAAFRFISEAQPTGDWLVLWLGEWDFRPSDNVVGNGSSGTIHLKEVSS